MYEILVCGFDQVISGCQTAVVSCRYSVTVCAVRSREIEGKALLINYLIDRNETFPIRRQSKSPKFNVNVNKSVCG